MIPKYVCDDCGRHYKDPYCPKCHLIDTPPANAHNLSGDDEGMCMTNPFGIETFAEGLNLLVQLQNKVDALTKQLQLSRENVEFWQTESRNNAKAGSQWQEKYLNLKNTLN